MHCYQEKICVLCQKTSTKRIFLVSRSTLRRFGISLYDFDDPQTQKKATQVLAQRAETIKKAPLMGKKLSFEPKTVKKVGFLGVFMSTLRRFGISPYDSDDVQTHRIVTQIDAQGVTIVKKALLYRKK